MTDAPKPLAQGDLAQTPLAHVVLSVLEKGLDGTLAIWPETERPGQDRVLFARGTPVDARLLAPASNLERGLLPLFHRERGPYAFFAADLVGETKLRGQVDPYSLLTASLRGGFRSEVVDAVLARFGDRPVRVNASAALSRFGLIPKERAVLDVLRAEPQSIRSLAQTSGEAKIASRLLYLLAITRQLEVFSGESLKKSATQAAPHGGARFADERGGAATRSVAPPGTPASARSDLSPDEAGPVPPHVASSASNPSTALGRTGSLPPAHAASPTQPANNTPPRRPGDPEPPPAMPPELAPEHAARWSEIVEQATRIEAQTYFEMLGVAQNASADDVRDAYFALVKRWHPDRLTPELLPLKPTAEGIFRHLTEAHETLIDADRRGPYLKSVQAGGGTPRAEREFQAILDAVMQFQKVDVLMRRRDFESALQLLDEILLLAPEEADYHAARGQVLFKMHGTQDPRYVEEALRSVDAALTRNERCERALVTKAEILQRTGNESESFALWRQIHELYPKNVDAQRMKRIADMRGVGEPPGKPQRPGKPQGPSKTGPRTSKAPPSGKDDGGLLSKLFGGKKK